MIIGKWLIDSWMILDFQFQFFLMKLILDRKYLLSIINHGETPPIFFIFLHSRLTSIVKLWIFPDRIHPKNTPWTIPVSRIKLSNDKMSTSLFDRSYSSCITLGQKTQTISQSIALYRTDLQSSTSYSFFNTTQCTELWFDCKWILLSCNINFINDKSFHFSIWIF